MSELLTALRRAAFIALIAAAALLRPGEDAAAARADALDMTSHVVYQIRPDQGTRHVAWEVTVVNNDPATSSGGSGGSIQFYPGVSLPVMADAQNITARSAGGVKLSVSTDPIPEAPIDAASIEFDNPFFYGETYSLSLSYDIPDTRREGLLVTPAYAFVPIVALGDQVTVDVSLPSAEPWSVELQPAECTQVESTFTCSGSDDIYVAALAEISRPDLTSVTSADVQLKEKKLTLQIRYFQGEDAFAQHVKDLAAASLPVMEELFGFNYSGPAEVRLEERGRVITLGYEGFATCVGESYCGIAVSPVASDHTVLHELAHLWTGLYSERWLAEGFAEFISAEAAARMPAGLVTGDPGEWPQPSVELQLDVWGPVNVSVGISEDKRAIENAGYYRSERFMSLLQSELGLDALRRANAALAEETSPADSREFMDALEDASGRNNDLLFREWVFTSAYDGKLADRREARDRLNNLIARAQEERLSDKVPAVIEAQVEVWNFEAALAGLDEAEASLEAYAELKEDLASVRAEAEAVGLTVAGRIDDAIEDWDFERARDIVEDAEQALALYLAAREKVDAPRNPWERFGLLGSDPESDLEAAATAFNAADYDRAKTDADNAIDTIDGASGVAARRVLIVAGGAAVFALLILAVVWYARRDVEPGVESRD